MYIYNIHLTRSIHEFWWRFCFLKVVMVLYLKVNLLFSSVPALLKTLQVLVRNLHNCSLINIT